MARNGPLPSSRKRLRGIVPDGSTLRRRATLTPGGDVSSLGFEDAIEQIAIRLTAVDGRRSLVDGGVEFPRVLGEPFVAGAASDIDDRLQACAFVGPVVDGVALHCESAIEFFAPDASQPAGLLKFEVCALDAVGGRGQFTFGLVDRNVETAQFADLAGKRAKKLLDA
jgi:hypothetical protein